MADYAHAYGGLPRPDDPWPLVVALVRRVPGRFEARERLRILDGVAGGIGLALGGSNALRRQRDDLSRQAYPMKDTPGRDFPLMQPDAEPEGDAPA